MKSSTIYNPNPNPPFNTRDIEQFIELRLEECADVRVAKGDGYSEQNDRLANFKQNAADTGSTPEQVWWIYMNKHLECIRKWVRGEIPDTGESLESRFTDAINYLLLGRALLAEQRYATAGCQSTQSGDIDQSSYSPSAKESPGDSAVPS